MTVKLNEVKIDKNTGLLKTNHGISVNIDEDKVSRFGGAFRIDKIPDGLNVIQRGRDKGHYEIVPSRSMSLDEYQELLNQIELFHLN
ncbi:hypothetical protein [Clostridium sp. C8-1-8]|uniref:hypothetical protein n=1 Tax=Clostridium sp. C8-1-8 TaxID=2698831 RepID=UPI001923EDCD|nr:hypothetical protein [Clostridium sp. C8-1-8]